MSDSSIGYAAIAPNKIISVKYGNRVVLEDGTEHPVIRKDLSCFSRIKTVETTAIKVEEQNERATK